MEKPAVTNISAQTNLALQSLPVADVGFANAEQQDQVVSIFLGDGTTYSLAEAYLADGQQVISIPSYLLFNKAPADVALQTGLVDQELEKVYEETETLSLGPVANPTSDQNSLECQTCSVSFTTRRLYKKHMKIHDGKPFRCSKCMETFNHEENYVLHQALHSGGPHQCPSCNKIFNRIASLKAHLLIHQVEESITCPDCEEEFNSRDDFDLHVRTHELVQTNESKELKHFSCQYCSVQFTSYAVLRTHSKIHEKVKPYLVRKQRKSLATTKRRLNCDQCTLSFDKPNQLARHKRVHTGEKPFKCETCGKGFTQKNSLQVHVTTHTGNKPYKCPFCPYSTGQKGNLRSHIRCVHIFTGNSDEGYKCEECNSIFRRPGSLSTHISRFHMNPVLPPGKTSNAESLPNTLVPACDTEKTSGPDILQKALENSGVGAASNEGDVEDTSPDSGPTAIFQNQPITPAKLAKASANKSHGLLSFTEKLSDGTSRKQRVKFIMEEDGKRYLCNFCTKSFKKPSDLLRHHRIHNNERPFKCPQCFRAFRLRSTLTSHLRAHEGIKIHKCNICDKKFSSSSSLSVHSRLHTGLKPYKCQNCQKTFRTKSHYNVHIRGHLRASQSQQTANNDAPSEVNSAPAAKPPLLGPLRVSSEGVVPETKSLVIDTSERPHVCLECGAAYKKSNHLKQHMQSHTGTKPYSCPTCSKAFGSSSILKAHMLTHSDERNFQCEICTQKFGTRTTLKRHMTIHSEERPYLCPYCRKAFKTKSQCKKHIRVHAAEVMRLSMVNAEKSDGNSVTSLEQASESSALSTSVAQSLAPGAVSVIQQPISAQTQNPESTDAAIVTVIPNENPDTSSHETDCVVDSQMGNVLVPLDNLVLLPDEQPSRSSGIESEVAEGGILYGQAMESNTFATFTLQGDHLEFNSLTQSTNLANILPEGTILGSPVARYDLSAVNAENEGDNSQDYICQLCGKVFYDITYFKYHMDCHVDSLNDTSRKDHEGGKTNENSGVLEGDPDEVDSEIRHRAVVEASRAVSEKIFMDSLVAKSSSKEDRSGSGNAKAANQLVPTEERENVRKNSCSFCGKFFRKASDLIRHVRVHTGEKPFSCSACHKSFSLKSTLEHHIRTHLQSKNFACHICSKLFASRDTLKVHMRLHTGVKPFECPECKATFRTTGHRASHMKTHLKGKNGQGAQKNIRGTEPTVTLNVVCPQESPVQPREAQTGIIYVDGTGAIQITAFDPEVLTIGEGEILEEFHLGNETVIQATALEGSESGLAPQQSTEVTTVSSIDSSNRSDDVSLMTTTINVEAARGAPRPPPKYKWSSCIICQANFKTEKAFQKHVCKPQHRPSFTCTVCQSSFPDKSTFIDHIKLSHPSLNFPQSL